MTPAILHEETLRGGAMWSWHLKRHTTLRITDLEGGANVGLMAWQSEAPSNRLNIPDTLKAQYTARLTRGHVLMSDMGHAMLSITEDSVGWHDPIAGHSNSEIVLAKYGPATYQEKRNDWHRNAHDNFLLEAATHGLTPRDLVANVNFFSRVGVDPEGAMKFHPGNSQSGSQIDLRAEINTLLILNTSQHPLDPNPAYAPRPVRLTILATPPPAPDDFCTHFRKENERAFQLSAQLFT